MSTRVAKADRVTMPFGQALRPDGSGAVALSVFDVCASSSAKYGTAVWVAVSRMTIGAFDASDRPMFVDVAMLRPGDAQT